MPKDVIELGEKLDEVLSQVGVLSRTVENVITATADEETWVIKENLEHIPKVIAYIQKKLAYLLVCSEGMEEEMRRR